MPPVFLQWKFLLEEKFYESLPFCKEIYVDKMSVVTTVTAIMSLNSGQGTKLKGIEIGYHFERSKSHLPDASTMSWRMKRLESQFLCVLEMLFHLGL